MYEVLVVIGDLNGSVSPTVRKVVHPAGAVYSRSRATVDAYTQTRTIPDPGGYDLWRKELAALPSLRHLPIGLCYPYPDPVDHKPIPKVASNPIADKPLPGKIL